MPYALGGKRAAQVRHGVQIVNRAEFVADLGFPPDPFQVDAFDAIDKLKEYDEKILLKRLPDVQKAQLSNLKAHLYKQILASLRDAVEPQPEVICQPGVPDQPSPTSDDDGLTELFDRH